MTCEDFVEETKPLIFAEGAAIGLLIFEIILENIFESANLIAIVSKFAVTVEQIFFKD